MGRILLPKAMLSPSSPPPPPPPPPYTGVSPTGRSPSFAWSPATQGVLNQMVLDNHWYWNNILVNANKTGTSLEQYGDWGAWCAYVYQATGDATYAAKAWARLNQADRLAADVNSLTFNPNIPREQFMVTFLTIDIIWPALDATAKGLAIGYMKEYSNFCTANGTPTNRGGNAISDSDRMVGFYGGMLALHYFNVPENPYYLNTLQLLDRNTGLASGAIVATGTSGSFRNILDSFLINYAVGGMWVESEGGYNEGTVRLLLMLYQIAESIAPGSFPHLETWMVGAASVAQMEMSHSQTQQMAWGDTQSPRNLPPERGWSWRAMLAGLLQSINPTAAALAQRAQQDYATAKLSALTNNSLHERAYYGFNPYITPATIPAGRRTYDATGMQMQYVKDDDSVFWLHAPPPPRVHHLMDYSSHYQLYWNNEWILTAPLCYGSNGIGGSNRIVNGVTLAGLNRSGGYTRAMPYKNSGTDWISLTQTSTGGYNAPGYYDPPPEFCHLYRRQLVHLKVSGHHVVIDNIYVDAEDPRTLPKLTRYRTSNPAEQTQIAAQEAVKLHVLHTRTLPAIAGDVATWTTAGGIVCEAHNLSPTAMTLAVVDEVGDAVWPSAGIPGVSERKWEVTMKETSEQQVTKFVQVVMAGTGTKPAVSYNSSLNRVTVGTRTFQFGATGVSEV